MRGSNLFDVKSLVAVIALERPDALVQQHVPLQGHLLPEPLPALVDGTGELEREVLGRVRLLLVLHQVLDHLEAAAALIAPDAKMK